MKKADFCTLVVLICVSLLLMMGSTIGCRAEKVNKVQEVTLDQLFANLDKYNGRQVIVEGFYFHGFEIIVLSERLEYSGYAEGHLVPKGKMLWVEGGIPKEIYDKLKQQQMMGPSERYGKLRIEGMFEYGGKYGHLGSYDAQIVPSRVHLIPWSPPVVQSETQGGEGFAIYLTKEDIPPEKMEMLSHVDIAEQPIVSIQDIITYNAQTHEIRLTDEAFERIANLRVPVSGKSFLVCVDGVAIYWGAFWTPISSMSFDGVTIWKPLGSQESKAITLELGYPSFSFYEGEDPRNDLVVLDSLEQSGKLINELSITSTENLPRSFKGYELYSWEEDSKWHFTLITGTNRTKTMEEITSKEDSISETGWVKIHVVGADAIKDVLSRLPEGESVFWCDELHIGQTAKTHISLQLPPEQVTDVIEEYAKQLGLDFTVPVRS